MLRVHLSSTNSTNARQQDNAASSPLQSSSALFSAPMQMTASAAATSVPTLNNGGP
jgi:hypothetical protein